MGNKQNEAYFLYSTSEWQSSHSQKASFSSSALDFLRSEQKIKKIGQRIKMFSMSGAQSYAKKHTFKKHDFFLKEEKAKIPSLVMLLKHKESACVRCHTAQEILTRSFMSRREPKKQLLKAQKCQNRQKNHAFLQKLQIVVPCKRVCFHPCSKSLLQCERSSERARKIVLMLNRPDKRSNEKSRIYLASTSVKLARPGVSAIIYKREKEDLRENKKRGATER